MSERIHMDNCEGCRKPLFEDDLVHAYDDGPMLCEGCAPTFDECKIQYDGYAAEGILAEVFGTADEADLVVDYISAQIAMGRGAQKHVWTLGQPMIKGSPSDSPPATTS